MFGRRRNPLIGAAVVVGASRHAARREVSSQNTAAANADSQQKSEQAEQDKRTQDAIDAALLKERKEREENEKGRVDGGREKEMEREKIGGGGDVFFCRECGGKNFRGQKFCGGCGEKLGGGEGEKGLV